jgi:N-carbamoyl-L-amino-acid hydrolase
LKSLPSFTEADRPYTRLVFSPEFDAARNWLADAFAGAGLDCHIDSGGNLIGTRTAHLNRGEWERGRSGKGSNRITY